MTYEEIEEQADRTFYRKRSIAQSQVDDARKIRRCKFCKAKKSIGPRMNYNYYGEPCSWTILCNNCGEVYGHIVDKFDIQ